ncbi:acyltransferase family protein [Sphingobacterium sp. HJSM2_6]|uniref:acyltransferase family protein n=1 Tax=Sphingobacterium sp. HJSM2_6 TaxID=3366264 RepID=UPI003BED20B6
MEFRNDIQGLRALAFISVFIFHLNPNWLPGGFIGVDLFFVISGYLITAIILTKIDKNKFNSIDFYLGRIKRIGPAYYMLLLAVLIAGYILFLPVDLLTLRKSVVSAMLFCSNFYLGNSDSYFGAKLAENPLLHTWSLAVEMQFYFLLPIVLIFIKRKYLAFIMASIILVITGYYQYQISQHTISTATYFSVWARVPEFLIGSLFTLVLPKGIKNNKVHLPIAILGLFILLVSLAIIHENTFSPGVIALFPCVGIAFILISNENLITKFLATKPMTFIGTLSYSLYLWHWPVMALIRYKNGTYEGYVFNNKDMILITVLTFVLGWLSYTFIEKTFRQWSNKKVISILSVLVIPMAIISYFFLTPKYKKGIPDEYSRATFSIGSHNNLQVDTLGSKSDRHPKILLIGDSHANVIKPTLDYVGRNNEFSFKTMTDDSFPAINGIDTKEIKNVDMIYYDNSRKQVDKTYELINESNVIIIATNGLDEYPSFSNAISKLAQELKPNQRIILVNTFPIINRNPVRVTQSILKKGNPKFQVVDRTLYKSRLNALLSQHANISVLDLSQSKIFKDIPYLKDTLIYYDDKHINVKGSVELGRDLEKQINSCIQNALEKVNNP